MSLQKVKALKCKTAVNHNKTLQLALKKSKKQNKALVEAFVDERRELEKKVDKFENIFDQLKGKVECPVCLEIPRSSPAYVCPNGHIICKKCKTNSCPSCRVAMGTGKSLLAVTIMENVDHKCKFVDCEELYAMDKLDFHEKICKHRIVNCPYEKCIDKVVLSKLLEHFEKKPCSSVLTVVNDESKSESTGFNVMVDNEPANDLRQLYWKVDLYSYKGTEFAICSSKHDNFFYITMVMFESEAECAKYKIEMEVHEADSSGQDSEVSFIYRGQPCSVDVGKDERRYLGLTVNHKGMAKIIGKSKTLTFNVSFKFYDN